MDDKDTGFEFRPRLWPVPNLKRIPFAEEHEGFTVDEGARSQAFCLCMFRKFAP